MTQAMSGAARRVVALAEPLRDRGVRAVVVLLAATIAGFALLAWAWHGVARTIYVPFQLPWVMSAGLAGLALVGASLGALTVHLGRRSDAEYRAATDDVVRLAIELVDDVAAGRTTLRRGTR